MLLNQMNIQDLSIADRIQLVTEIWDSITESPENVPVTDAQKQELDARLQAYEQNSTDGCTWSEVRKRIGH